MGLRGDERAQSVQVGAVILFGFLIVGLATYQVTVVPSQNEQAEFEQSQAVRGDMAELRNGLQTTGVTGESQPVEIQLGTRFQPRTLFVNPPPAAGTVRTQELETDTATVTFVNASVDSSVGGEADDYWAGNESFETKLLLYEGDYREYDAAPANVSIQLGHVVASYEDDRTVNVTDRPGLVQGDRLTLVLVQGNFSQNGVDTTTVDPSSVSRVTRREEVSGTINVTVPTTLPPERVAGLFAEINESSPIDVQARDANKSQAVNVTLDTTGTNIKLGIAAVEIESGAPNRELGYVDVQAVEDVSAGQTGDVVVEVRDEYGNPVSGARLNATIAGNATFENGNQERTSVTTDLNGFHTFEYVPNGSTAAGDEILLNVTFDPLRNGTFEPRTPANATVELEVEGGGGGGGGGDDDDSNSSADQTTVGSFSSYSEDADGKKESLQFDIANTGSSDVTIDNVTVTNVSGGPDVVQFNGNVLPGGNEEILVSGDPNSPYDDPNGLGIGEVSPPLGVTISDGETVTFTIRGAANGGANQERDLAGRTVSIEITFSDGSTKTITETVS